MALTPPVNQQRYVKDKQGLSTADRTENALTNFAASDAKPTRNNAGSTAAYKSALQRAQQSNAKTARPHEGAL